MAIQRNVEKSLWIGKLSPLQTLLHITAVQDLSIKLHYSFRLCAQTSGPGSRSSLFSAVARPRSSAVPNRSPRPKKPSPTGVGVTLIRPLDTPVSHLDLAKMKTYGLGQPHHPLVPNVSFFQPLFLVRFGVVRCAWIIGLHLGYRTQYGPPAVQKGPGGPGAVGWMPRAFSVGD